MNHTLSEPAWEKKHRMGRGRPQPYCRCCRGAGKSLATHCVGRMLTDEEEGFIEKGVLDFANGRWSDSQPAAAGERLTTNTGATQTAIPVSAPDEVEAYMRS